MFNRNRMTREKSTLNDMIKIYCNGQHQSKDDLCTECRELLDYAIERIEKCPFGENKTTCAKCPVHCYNTVMREKIRNVMHYSGPRMLYRHPVNTLFHYIKGLKKEPSRVK